MESGSWPESRLRQWLRLPRLSTAFCLSYSTEPEAQQMEDHARTARVPPTTYDRHSELLSKILWVEVKFYYGRAMLLGPTFECFLLVTL